MPSTPQMQRLSNADRLSKEDQTIMIRKNCDDADSKIQHNIQPNVWRLLHDKHQGLLFRVLFCHRDLWIPIKFSYSLLHRSVFESKPEPLDGRESSIGKQSLH